MPTYLKESERTAVSDKAIIHPHLYEKRNGSIIDNLIYLMGDGINADLLKRAIFYADEPDKLQVRKEAMHKKMDILLAGNRGTPVREIPESLLPMLHTALGVISEGMELLEAVIAALIIGRDLDSVNLKEELGDVLWYVALGARNLNTDFETLAESNIAKLKTRFPDKFTQEKVLNRDLEEERKVLENEQ